MSIKSDSHQFSPRISTLGLSPDRKDQYQKIHKKKVGIHQKETQRQTRIEAHYNLCKDATVWCQKNYKVLIVMKKGWAVYRTNGIKERW